MNIPTLVEVKRKGDTRIRREVVGQMLDYAANGVVYWPVDTIRTRFEARCNTMQGRVPGDVLCEALGAQLDVEGFWQNVRSNLQAGRVSAPRLPLGQIPRELRRIVEFLNGTDGSGPKCLRSRIRQYLGEGLKVLVPRVYGQTAEAERTKQGSRPKFTWDADRFLEEATQRLSPGAVEAVERVLQATKELTADLGFGRGEVASISPKFAEASEKSFFTLRVDGTLTVNRKWHEQEDAGPNATLFRDQFVTALRSAGIDLADTPYPSLPAAVWVPKVDPPDRGLARRVRWHPRRDQNQRLVAGFGLEGVCLGPAPYVAQHAFDHKTVHFDDRANRLRMGRSEASETTKHLGAEANVLARVGSLNLWKRHGERAPHKPLLILLAVGRLQRGEPDSHRSPRRPRLNELLQEFGTPSTRPSAQYPFWRLQGDGLWEVEAPVDLTAPEQQHRPEGDRAATGRGPWRISESGIEPCGPTRNSCRVSPGRFSTSTFRLHCTRTS